MSEVQPRDVLARVSPKLLDRYNALAVLGPGRGLVDPLAYTFSRADASTCATYFDRDGILRLAAAGIPRIEWADLDADGIPETPGLVIEGTRTNVVLRNRDLTNASWTKTNATALRDQVGIDGVANTACSLQSSAANGTCLQAITLASSARAQSAYVKYIAGSGVVQMTMDNGSTWTNLALTNNWLRFSIPTQTLANPTVGFRIVTSGDKIAIDFVQNEDGTYPTNPIEVPAGSAITRAADAINFPIGIPVPPIGAYLSIFAKFSPRFPLTGSDGSTPGIFVLGGTGSFAVDGKSAVDVHRAPSTAQLNFRVSANSAGANIVSVDLPGSGPVELLHRIEPIGALHRVYAEIAGGGSGTTTSTDLASFPWRVQTANPGTRGNGATPGQILLFDWIVARGNFSLADLRAVP